MSIAIFNGYNFHMELYGYILHYGVLTNRKVIIYDTLDDPNEWIAWYKIFFTFELKPIEAIGDDIHLFDQIFLITDTDYSLVNIGSNIKKKIIATQHYHIRARPDLNSMPIRPFKHYKSFVLPIIPFNLPLNIQYKDEKYTHVVVLGIALKTYNIELLNKVKPTEPDKEVMFHFIARHFPDNCLDGFKRNHAVYQNLKTQDMVKIISNCNYILIDATDKAGELKKKATSGAIGLAWSFLKPMVMSNKTNKYYNFKNVVQYYEPMFHVFLYNINLEDLKEERDSLLDIKKYIELNLKDMILPEIKNQEIKKPEEETKEDTKEEISSETPSETPSKISSETPSEIPSEASLKANLEFKSRIKEMNIKKFGERQLDKKKKHKRNLDSDLHTYV